MLVPRTLPIVVAVTTALALVLSVIVAWSGVHDAALTVARGDAQHALDDAQQALLALGGRPTQDDLASILAALADEGVRYVAVHDPEGSIEAGVLAPGFDERLPEPGSVDAHGSIVRAVTRLAPPGGPPSRGHRPRPPGASFDPPGPPPFGPPFGPPRGPTLVIEIEAPTVEALETRAAITLAVGIVAAVLMVLAALALERAARDRAEAIAEAARARHLSSLGAMSAVLAHEIRNPLASLKGHAQLLEESFGEGTRERAKAGRVVHEATRIERLTEDLLAFVRSGAITRAAHDPRTLARQAMELAPGAVLDDAAAPAEIDVDADRLRGALENLLRNAVQASPAAESVELVVRAEGTDTCFVVRDRGPGIAAGEEERIFEPFHTTRTQGTGLGLAIARRIVEAHGGTLVARNRAGGGAELELRIPRRS